MANFLSQLHEACPVTPPAQIGMPEHVTVADAISLNGTTAVSVNKVKVEMNSLQTA